MKIAKRAFLLLAAAATVTFAAEQFELGAAAGYGTFRNPKVTRGNVTGEAGFDKGLLFSVVAGHQMWRLVGGEVRYTYRDSPLLVSSGGRDVTFAGDTQIVHYDALIHARPWTARFSPYLAFGGGIKIYRGKGDEQESQPLQNLAILTRTNELKPMASVGGGVRLRIGDHVFVRFDFRDYITPFPTKVILPAPGASIGGWVHDLTPMVGISAFF